MLQFAWCDQAGLRQAAVAREFPFKIGRAPSCNLQLREPGVWDAHAEIRLESGRFILYSPGEAIVLVNNERVTARPLFPGDKVQIGAAGLQVSLSPARPLALRGREAAFWTICAIIISLEIVLIFLAA
jgi:pSer/pThr/pTyr-binding forkhead associated (FHA) protein